MHPATHLLFEGLAYFVAWRVYRSQRKTLGDPVPNNTRTTVLVAAVLGAAIGSKLLHHLASPSEFLAFWEGHSPLERVLYLAGGKTIVGALLGGWFVVEAVKRIYNIQSRTGDLFTFPLLIGMAIGRIGCLAAGLNDDTLGVPTDSIFGIDFGDGIPRHPAPLYEILFLVAFGFALKAYLQNPTRRFQREGDSFRLFLFGYLVSRFLVDFLKPYEVYGGLRIIQMACLIGAVILLRDLIRVSKATV